MEIDIQLKKLILSALMKPDESRDKVERKTLEQYAGQLPFFSKHVENGHKNIPADCSRAFRRVITSKGDVVFTMNSEGNRFYTIVDGSVGLFGREQDDSEGPSQHFGKQLRLLKILSEGKSFGELGLLGVFRQRSATVQCLSDCVFAVIEKEDFDTILKPLEQAILIDRLTNFVTENPIMKFSSKHTVKQVYFNAIFRTYSPSDVLFKENDPLDSIYIIKSGQFKVQREYLKQGHSQKLDEKPFSGDLKQSSNTSDTAMTLQALQRVPLKKHFVQLLILGKGQMFGYEDFLQKRSSYTYGVECKESGDVIIIRGGHFRKYLMSDVTTTTFLNEQMDQQLDYMAKREKEVLSSMEGFEQFYFETAITAAKPSSPCHEDEGDSSPTEESTFIPKLLFFKKLRHYRDSLAEDFQEALSKNFEERFGSDDLRALKDHVPQDIVHVVRKKIRIKNKVGIDKAPPKLSRSVLDYFKLNESLAAGAAALESYHQKPLIQISQAQIRPRPQSAKSIQPQRQSSIQQSSFYTHKGRTSSHKLIREANEEEQLTEEHKSIQIPLGKSFYVEEEEDIQSVNDITVKTQERSQSSEIDNTIQPVVEKHINVTDNLTEQTVKEQSLKENPPHREQSLSDQCNLYFHKNKLRNIASAKTLNTKSQGDSPNHRRSVSFENTQIQTSENATKKESIFYFSSKRDSSAVSEVVPKGRIDHIIEATNSSNSSCISPNKSGSIRNLLFPSSSKNHIETVSTNATNTTSSNVIGSSLKTQKRPSLNFLNRSKDQQLILNSQSSSLLYKTPHTNTSSSSSFTTSKQTRQEMLSKIHSKSPFFSSKDMIIPTKPTAAVESNQFPMSPANSVQSGEVYDFNFFRSARNIAVTTSQDIKPKSSTKEILKNIFFPDSTSTATTTTTKQPQNQSGYLFAKTLSLCDLVDESTKLNQVSSKNPKEPTKKVMAYSSNRRRPNTASARTLSGFSSFCLTQPLIVSDICETQLTNSNSSTSLRNSYTGTASLLFNLLQAMPSRLNSTPTPLQTPSRKGFYGSMKKMNPSKDILYKFQKQSSSTTTVSSSMFLNKDQQQQRQFNSLAKSTSSLLLK